MRRMALFVSAAALLAGAADRARADLIFNDPAANSDSSRSGTDDPVTFISNVAQDTAITQIGILDTLSSAGDLKFFVYDITLSTLEYSSAPKAFAADTSGDTWKLSDPFAFTLLAGDQYYIGAVADVPNLAPFYFPPSDHTENGITSDSSNGNFDYNLNIEGGGSASIPLQLYAPAVPEPSSLALAGLGGLAVTGAGWRRRRRGA